MYNVMSDFQRKRKAARAEYLRKMALYQGAEDTAFYADKREEAGAERWQAVAEAKAAAIENLLPVLDSMRLAARGISSAAPTDDQMRILSVLQMRKHLTQNDLDSAANAMHGNGLALEVLHELARAHDIPENYASMATKGLAPAAATRLVKDLEASCGGILKDKYGARRSAVLNAVYQARRYNKAYDPDDLEQEPDYNGAEDFFSRISSVPYSVIEQAVNGE